MVWVVVLCFCGLFDGSGEGFVEDAVGDGFGQGDVADFAADVVKAVLGEVEEVFAFVCELVDFAGSFVVEVPLAFDVAFLFQVVEEGVDGAGAKVNAKVFADDADDLVAVHGFRVEKLEDN